MNFKELANVYAQLEKTSSGNALRDILSSFFKRVPNEELEHVTYLTLGKIASDFADVNLGMADKMVLRAIANAGAVHLDDVVKRYKQTGDAGIVAAEIVGKRRAPLTVNHVFSQLHAIANASGAGSQEHKISLLAELLKSASQLEAKYLCRIVLAKLRLGVADKTVLDSLAIAFTGSKANASILDHAYQICPDVGVIARTLITKGLRAVEKIGVLVGRPVQSMLCQRVDSLQMAADKLGMPFVAEEKYDGERIQCHKDGAKVTLFSRRLENVTLQFPDIAAAIKKLPAKTLVLDAEVMPIDVKTGKLLPFQVLMSRRRKHGIEEMMRKIPIKLFVFDILYLNGTSLLDIPYEKRHVTLKNLVKPTKTLSLTTRIVCKDTDAAEELFNKVVEEGGEGIVLKSLNGPYQAGVRGWHWVKWKPEYTKNLRDTFDLTIVGAWQGTGKRGGNLSSYLCAVYDKKKDRFLTFCKVASGFSEADLTLLPKKLAKYKTAHKPARLFVAKTMTPDVWFNPGIVIEVLGAEITKSPNHSSGLALRFPRFLRYRDDKTPEESTSVDELQRMAKA